MFFTWACIYCKKFTQLKFIDAQLLGFGELKYPKGPLQIFDLISKENWQMETKSKRQDDAECSPLIAFHKKYFLF